MKTIRKALVAVTITAMVVIAVVVSSNSTFCNGRTDELIPCKVSDSFKTPLRSFKIHAGRFPTSVEGLKTLVASSGHEGWRGPYVEAETELLDPWGRSFRYRIPGIHNYTSYDLFSLGEDGIESADDIIKWD